MSEDPLKSDTNLFKSFQDLPLPHTEDTLRKWIDTELRIPIKYKEIIIQHTLQNSRLIVDNPETKLKLLSQLDPDFSNCVLAEGSYNFYGDNGFNTGNVNLLITNLNRLITLANNTSPNPFPDDKTNILFAEIFSDLNTKVLSNLIPQDTTFIDFGLLLKLETVSTKKREFFLEWLMKDVISGSKKFTLVFSAYKDFQLTEIKDQILEISKKLVPHLVVTPLIFTDITTSILKKRSIFPPTHATQGSTFTVENIAVISYSRPDIKIVK